MKHIALVGFMASGKSTIGRKLARKLGRRFADTDSIVTRAHGPIAAIFAREGEDAFRRYEEEALRVALDDAEPSVVALGGGALTVAANQRLVADRAYRIFIKVPAEQILARVRRSHEIRPMLGSTPTLERVRELYERRMPDYENADCVIDASRRRDASVIDEIVEWLRGTNTQ